MDFYANKDLALCGLACVLCSNEACPGCKARGCPEGSDCSVYQCVTGKGLEGCYQCAEFPCDEDILQGTRIRAFNHYARQFGKPALLNRLQTNFENGLTYHKPGGLRGDYDQCETEQGVIDLLTNGKPNPYDRCPEYESKSFLLRLVSPEDAPDLLDCYKNPTLSVQANAENCTYGYGSQTVDEMRECIRRWLEEYANRSFIRFSIVAKQVNKAIGTIEIFLKWPPEKSFLRIDLASQYEKEEYLSELLQVCDVFFQDLRCEQIVTRGLPDAVCRVNALKQNGYVLGLDNTGWALDHDYIKADPARKT